MVKILKVEEYAEYVGKEMDDACDEYDRMDLMKLEKNEKISVFIDNFTDIWGHQESALTHPFYGAIFFPSSETTASALQFVVAHELFHIKQLRDVGWGSLKPPKLIPSDDPMTWFTDASADYAAGRIVWTRDTEPGRTMGKDINARFLQASLRYNVAGNDNDPHSGHMYSASHFLDYLLNGRPTLGSPKPANPTQRDINQRFVQIWGEMMSWKTKKGSIDALGVLRQWAGGSFDFDSAFEDFAAYFLFNVNSPMPGKPKKVPDKARSGNVCGLLLKDSQSTCDSIKIKGWYSAGLWDVAVEVDPTKQPRTVTVEPVEDVSDVIVKVYVLPKNERQNFGLWVNPKPKCPQATKNAPCMVSVTYDDNVLYVVATNSGSQDREVTVKVSTVDLNVDPPKIESGAVGVDYNFAATAKGIPSSVKTIRWYWDLDEMEKEEIQKEPFPQSVQSRARRQFMAPGDFELTVSLYDTTRDGRGVLLAEATVPVSIKKDTLAAPKTTTPLGSCKCPCAWGPLAPSDIDLNYALHGMVQDLKWQECANMWAKKCGCPNLGDMRDTSCMIKCCFP